MGTPSPCRRIAHVDMDAFYASIEIRDDPALAGRPVVVGGAADARGVVAAASYEARRYGVRSAMPMREAIRRCPALVRIPARMSHYAAVSRTIMTLLETFSPAVEPLSLDEAFLDLTGTERALGAARAVGTRIRSAIRKETGLTASVGIAPVKFVAKIASDLDKPDGFVVVDDGEVRAFLDPLPIRRLWGVGPKTAETLAAMGIRRIGDIARMPRTELTRRLGLSGEHLHDLASGHDERSVVRHRDAKSYSHEITFARDQSAPEVLHATLLDHAASVSRRLRKDGVAARTIQLKLRDGRFHTWTRRRTLAGAVHATEDLYEPARALLAASWDGRPLRLLGFGVTGVEPRQGETDAPTLFSTPSETPARRDRLDSTLDRLESRFGRGTVLRAGQLRRRDTRDAESTFRPDDDLDTERE